MANDELQPKETADEGFVEADPAAPAPMLDDSALANTRTIRGLSIRVKHDARVRDQRVRLIVWKLRRICPWINDSDVPTCRAWAQLNLMADLCYARLKNEGFTTDSGEPKRLMAEYRALRSAELQYARELGLTPAARRQMAGLGEEGTDLAAAFAALNAAAEQSEPKRVDRIDDAEAV